MSTHAWFGAGAMGAAFVERLRAAGAEVIVWNRTFEKAAALEAFGATAVRDAVDAARRAEFLHVMLSDDAAVDGLLATIAGAIVPAAVTIDHSTVTPAATVERFASMAARGRAFLHAPVFASPTTARQGGGTMLVAGAAAPYALAQPTLDSLVSDVWYLGDDPRSAAGMKLFGNEMLFAAIAGLVDGLAIAQASGIDPHRALELFAHFKLQGAIQFRGKKIVEKDFAPLFGLTMARKDARLMLETAAAAGLSLQLLPAIAARMDALIAEGHGGDDLSVLARDLIG